MKKPRSINTELVTEIIESSLSTEGNLGDLIERMCTRLRRHVTSVERVHVSFIPHHPQLRVGVLQWSPGSTVGWGHVSWPDEVRSPVYRKNPLYALRHGLTDEIRIRLGRSKSTERYRLTQSLAEEGFTDFFGVALAGGYVAPITMTFMTRAIHGFSDVELRSLRTFAWASQPAFQRETLRELASTICSTYIGKEAGHRVVCGEMRRGQSSRMEAVVWFSDLRGFTPLAQTVSEEKLIQYLNIFFDTVGQCIEENGGEILKFIGDAILAVFPYDGAERAREACDAAVRSALVCLETLDALNEERLKRNEPTLRAGIGLHRGEVVYGNIGTTSRLDFTVLGQPVNLASRIESKCSEIGEFLLVSSTVASATSMALTSRGTHRLRGIQTPVELFGLPPDRVFESSKAPQQVVAMPHEQS
ncbi:MAG: adenylate/guanylate cyclase domain-containing protein [Myxococcota bacterium]|nr:adenylate/guanylate cyclase domain-containing protein [Myxococcota bacterium]